MENKEYLVIILVPIIILLLNFTITLHSEPFFNKQFEKNNLEKNSYEISNNLIQYLTKKAPLEEVHYSKKEISHLEDVQKLINNLHVILYISLIVLLAISYKINIKKAIFYGSITTIFLIISLSFINFNWLFLKFHLLSFNNYNWLLPSNSTLITLFPITFFESAFKKIIFQSLALSTILALTCSQSLKSSRINN